VTKGQLINCWAHRCGHDANNTYYGFRIDGYGWLVLGGGNYGQTDANRTKYGIWNVCASSSGANANRIIGFYSDDHVTQGVFDQSGGSRISYEAPLKNQIAVTATSSFSMDQRAHVHLTRATAGNVDLATAIVPTQEGMITFGDSNITLRAYYDTAVNATGLITSTFNLRLPGGVNSLACTPATVLKYRVMDGAVNAREMRMWAI
jgi:hypothetical protein